jgi:hypothetical protein
MKPMRRERGDGAQTQRVDRIANRRRQLVQRFNAGRDFSPPVPAAAQIVNPAFVNEAAAAAVAIQPYDTKHFSRFVFDRCGFQAEPGQPVVLADEASRWWSTLGWRSQIGLELLSGPIHADEQSQPWQICR